MEFKKDSIVTVTIEDMGTEGEGIGKVDGYTLFIKDAVVGDTIKAKIIKSKKNYGYARVVEILAPSALRTEPKCPCAGPCGGCQIQSMSYEAQLRFKQDKVTNNLIRIGGFEREFILNITDTIVGIEEPWHYRNKAQYPIGTDKDGNPIAGFYAGRTHSIIANNDCALGRPENKGILETVLAHMKKYRIPAYNEETGTGLVRHVLIRSGFQSGEIMVCLILNCRKPGYKGEWLPGQTELLDALFETEGMTSVSVSLNAERTNVIMGTEIHVLRGTEIIRDSIRVRDMSKEGMPFTGEKLEFAISPLSFFQVDPVQTEKLYSLALQYADLKENDKVWDLYCGIGTISLFMAMRAGKVYGVEIIPEAIADAKENAKRNRLSNTEFFVGKAEEVLPAFYRKEGDAENSGMTHPDVIVVDPPRKGCDEQCLATMLAMAPERIVYVSCDSATLARDLRILCDGGYELKKVRAVDQFPQTVHVETVVLLSQRKADDYLEVEIDLDELDATSAETKGTYEDIKKYVAEHNNGMKVSNLYIAQVKKKCGIELGQNFNLQKSENAKQPQCPKEKEDAIVEALRHFSMI